MTQEIERSPAPGRRTGKAVYLGTLCAVLVSLAPCTHAQSDDREAPGFAPLFASHTPLRVTITAPLTTLMEERPDEEYLEGTFSYLNDDGTEQTLDLKIRTRGNFRRKADICNFAPVRLNFRKKQVKDTLFHGQDKLKLVTHCQNKRAKYENRALREYLVYRMFQALTDKSFAVRLLQITWVDTEDGKPMLKYGFAIEDDDDVAKRNGMKMMKSGDVTQASLDPGQQNLVNVFQYMIGNTDFSLIRGPANDYCCHNAMLMSATKGPPYTPLPYDFDFSGLVYADYAAPNPRFKLSSVRERLYRGQCANNHLLPDTFDYFLEKKDELYGLVRDLTMVSANTRTSVMQYLDRFYDDITDPDKIAHKFTNNCNEAAETS